MSNVKVLQASLQGLDYNQHGSYRFVLVYKAIIVYTTQFIPSNTLYGLAHKISNLQYCNLPVAQPMSVISRNKTMRIFWLVVLEKYQRRLETT